MKKSIFVIFLITVSAIVFYGIRYVKTPVNTEVAYMTKSEETISGSAFIIKNELVHTVPTSGTVYRYPAEGERVGKNRRIASVYKGTVNTDVLQELNNIEKKIELVKTQNNTNQDLISDTASASEESRVSICKNNILEAVYKQDISKISSYKEDIKNIRLGTYEEDDNTELKELEQKKLSLESGLGTSRQDVYSKISGVFVSSVDGYETTLTPDTIKKFTVSDFKALTVPSTQNIKTTADSGDEICKVIDNSAWYAMIKVEASKFSSSYSKGSKVTIKFDSLPGGKSDAVIENISPEENGEIVLTIKSDKYIDGVFALRYSDAEIILKSYAGFKIPIYAIHVEDGKQGVLVEKDGASIFKPCEILYTDESGGFVIVQSEKESKTPLEQMDRILVGEK